MISRTAFCSAQAARMLAARKQIENDYDKEVYNGDLSVTGGIEHR